MRPFALTISTLALCIANLLHAEHVCAQALPPPPAATVPPPPGSDFAFDR